MDVTPISRKTKKHRMNVGLRRFFTTVVLFLLIIAVTVAIFVFYPMAEEARKKQNTPAPQQPTADNVVVIRDIQVEGNRHLTEETIILASGLKVGQNFMTVSKNAATANILENCPYVKSVTITSSTYDSYVIKIEEKTAIGAMYADGRWVVLGDDLTALGYLELTSDSPDRYLYVKGAEPSGNGLGEPAMNDRCSDALGELLKLMDTHGVTGINCIDLTDLSEITLEWKHQIRVELGTEANLEHKLRVFNATLPMVLETHGQQAEGTMDLSAYSDGDGANQMLYTPGDQPRITTTTTGEFTSAVSDSTDE